MATPARPRSPESRRPLPLMSSNTKPATGVGACAAGSMTAASASIAAATFFHMGDHSTRSPQPVEDRLFVHRFQEFSVGHAPARVRQVLWEQARLVVGDDH